MKDEERVDELEELYENLKYILGRLWDNALDAKKQRDEESDPEKKDFAEGVLEGYWEVFDTLESEIKINEINQEKIGFDYDLAELQ